MAIPDHSGQAAESHSCKQSWPLCFPSLAPMNLGEDRLLLRLCRQPLELPPNHVYLTVNIGQNYQNLRTYP